MENHFGTIFIIVSFLIIVSMIFFIKKLKNKLNEKEQQIKNQNAKINDLEEIKTKYQPLIDIEGTAIKLSSEKKVLIENIKKLKAYYSVYELKIDLEEMSFYQPKYDFGNYLEYHDALLVIREAQKELIKSKEVFSKVPNKNNKNIGNLSVNAFNGDANTIINSVTYDNFEKSKERLELNFNKINNLLTTYGLEINNKYFDLKVQEMGLVYDLKEQERKIKLEQQELRDQMKEEENARAEAEKAREKAIKEKERYELALEEARAEIEQKTGAERDKYEKQIFELEQKLKEAIEAKERTTAMAQITKRGHVYIISNIGSFGNDVYKIGMTRRVEPLMRVRELGDASVPFPFDIHAMIYAEDAPSLENALHNEFNEERMNKINTRKEFFKITIDDIEKKCVDLGYNIKLTKLAEALEYRQTKDLERERV